MIRIKTCFLAAVAVVVAACASAPPPVVEPQGEARFLVDPRIGWKVPTTPAIDKAFDEAWRYAMAGNFVTARERLAKIRSRNPGYAPALLAEAAIAMREDRLSDARAITGQLLQEDPDYTAAAVYQAELDIADSQIRSAYDRYRAIAARPDAPAIANERIAELQTRVFDQLYSAALAASDTEAVRLLREALVINPAATAARVTLVQRLVAQRKFDEARRELDPLLSSGEADRTEVQEALAEIDVGKGRFQQAINRYERLVRRDSDGRYARRLAEVKERFAQENMPPQYSRAVEADAITRADLAVLLYWKVTAVRFAQDVPAPPIAIDIAEAPGREELIRAIALGIFQVDPITRRVSPFAPVTTTSLARTAGRVLTLRGASCARGIGDTARVLAACNVPDPILAGADMPVSGRVAATVVDQLERALR